MMARVDGGLFRAGQHQYRKAKHMTAPLSSAVLSRELAQIALSMQAERTGHTPKAVTVVASEETVVLTLHEALTPAERILARTESGAAKVEQYHRALFAVSCDELRNEIQRLTGRRVREAAVVVEPATGAIVHAFTSGTVVQIFQLEPHGVTSHVSAGIAPDPEAASG
jgi:uncharacterized protein YbcI